MMITLTTVKIYRAVAITVVLIPLFLISLFEQTILASLIYIPMLSLTLAALAKYMDYYLVKAMLSQQPTDKLNNGFKMVSNKNIISCCKMAA